MKTISAIVLFSALMSAAGTANALMAGSITGEGSYFGEVSTDAGWVSNSAPGDGVDFWEFTLDEKSEVSIDILSDIDFGISIYRGLVSDDLGFAFENDASFTDPNTFAFGEFVAGTSNLGFAGSSLTDILLATAGSYTIAVGGAGGIGFGPIGYQMDVAVTPVPLPGGLGLALLGSSVLLWFRRKLQCS